MNYILFDQPQIWEKLLPLTYTRSASGLRVGINTIFEKWERALGTAPQVLTQPYLQSRYSMYAPGEEMFINSALCPDHELLRQMKELKPGEGIFRNEMPLIIRGQFNSTVNILDGEYNVQRLCENDTSVIIDAPWKIYTENAAQLKIDFEAITKGRKSEKIRDPYTQIYGKDNLFIEPGASTKAAIIDAENGPVYLGKNSFIGHGAMIRGALALLEYSEIAMGAKMRGDSTIGPFSKVGGEVANSVVLGYSNKGHEGYMGNSVIGEWCNIGADTNSSNMKNDYSEVRLWDYHSGRFLKTGRMFCGFVMGDHTKLGINVMINSGTSIGVACNLYNSGYLKNFIPSFTTGQPGTYETGSLKNALSVAPKVMSRRNVDFTETDRAILEKVFEISAKYRK